MAKKTQLPVIGGVRKVIMSGDGAAAGTTIAEFGSNTVTLAQLAHAIATLIPASNNSISSASSPSAASLTTGPGLSGGGPLLGSVALRLIAPIPFLVADESEDSVMIPGQQGPQGVQGPPGPVVFIEDESEESVYILVQL